MSGAWRATRVIAASFSQNTSRTRTCTASRSRTRLNDCHAASSIQTLAPSR